jgi:hypothetical protein
MNVLLFLVAGLALKFAMYPSLFLNPQIIQDGGVNYLLFAANPDWKFSVLTKLDAGYLPLLSRLMSVFSYRIFGLSHYAAITQYFVWVVEVLLVSAILHPSFKNLLGDIKVRFLVGLVLLSFPVCDTNLIENFAIFGGVFLGMITVPAARSTSKPVEFLKQSLAGVLFMSKPFLMAWLPVMAFGWCKEFKRTKQINWLILPAFLGALIQAAVMLRTRLRSDMWQGLGVENKAQSLSEFMVSVAMDVSREFASLGGLYSKAHSINCVLAVLTAILTTYCAVIAVKQRKKESLYGLGIWLASGFFAMALRIKAMGAMPWSWSAVWHMEPLWTRHFLATYLSFAIIFFALLRYLPKHGRRLAMALAVVFVARNVVVAEDVFANAREHPSQWQYYQTLMRQDAYCIPVNSFNDNNLWLMGRNCDYLNAGRAFGAEPILPEIKRSGELVLPSLTNSKHTFMGMIVKFENDDQAQATFNLMFKGKNQVALKAKQIVPNGYRYRSYFFNQPLELSSLRALYLEGEFKGAKAIYLVGQ